MSKGSNRTSKLDMLHTLHFAVGRMPESRYKQAAASAASTASKGPMKATDRVSDASSLCQITILLEAISR